MFYREEKDGLGSKLILEIKDESISQSEIDSFWLEVKNFEGKYSRFLENSELSELNRKVGQWTVVSEEMLIFLKKCEDLNKSTEGYFDIMVEKVLSGLGYDSSYSFQPKEFKPEIPGRIEFREDYQVKIPAPVEFGGFGKGYALDLAKKYFGDTDGACFNAGGDIWINGLDKNGNKWKVFLENPLNLNDAIGEIESEDLFMASSNAKKRSWRSFHHLINPHSSAPADQMMAVYVQAKEGFLVDSMSTTLFVMGFNKAKDFLSNSPLVEAMLISPKGEIWKTPGYQGKLYLSDSEN
jgi:thiamine biosynthesis lipoprotein